MKKFWMVFVEGGNSPVYKHETQQSAEKEAERLKRIVSEKSNVFVLESISIAQIIPSLAPIKHIPIDDLPF